MLLVSDQSNSKSSPDNLTVISSHPESSYSCFRRLPSKGKYKHDTLEIKPVYERPDNLLNERPLKQGLHARQNSE